MRSFFDAAPDVSQNVPILIGSVSEEGNSMASIPTETEWHAGLAKSYGEEKATAIEVTTLKANYPHRSKPPRCRTCAAVAQELNGLFMRNNVVKMCELKHDLHAAPAYAYYFTWQTPLFDGRPGALHTADLQFCFDNTKRCEQGTGNTLEAQALARKMAGSLGRRLPPSGKPSVSGVAWQPTAPDNTNRTT